MSIIRRSGFTIVELLVVIVVIGILASITIVSYSGIQSRAAKVVLQSDLRNSSLQLNLDRAVNAVYPATVGAANDGRGLSKSSTTAYNYSVTGGEYCLEATSSNTSAGTYYVSSPDNIINTGTCPITLVAVGDLYRGGKVAYILQSGDVGYNASVQHGLIASLSDMPSFPYPTQASAITACDNLVTGGYSDWYLPNMTELTNLYTNRVATGGFGGDWYVSSSLSGSPWVKSFLYGDGGYGFGGNYNARAVRTF